MQYTCIPLSRADSLMLRAVDPAIAAAGLAARAAGQANFTAPLLFQTDHGAPARLAAIAAQGGAQLGFLIAADGTIAPPPHDGAAVPDQPAFMTMTLTLPVPPVGSNAAAEAGPAWPPAWSMLGAPGTRAEMAPDLGPSLDISVPDIRASARHLPHHPRVDGSGVILGVVDWGCDFRHPAFRKRDGKTRISALWDQNGAAPSGTLGLGTPVHGGVLPGAVFDAAALDAALAAGDPYAALGYDPLSNSFAPAPLGATDVVHGTHVLDAAGGNLEGSQGVAPGAELMFVHLRPNALDDAARHANGGDVVAAAAFILHAAQTRNLPCALNLSMGNNTGPHDGTSVLERMLDAMAAKPGRAIVVPAGNNRGACLHASDQVGQDAPLAVIWHFQPGDTVPNTVDLWYETENEQPTIRFGVIPPGAPALVQASPDQALLLLRDGAQIGTLLEESRPPDGARRTWLQHCRIEAAPGGADERWTITAETGQAGPVRLDAWIDRSDVSSVSQSRFAPESADPERTLDSLACGHRTICAGAYYAASPEKPGSAFSSLGPTRDGRRKPDVAAPGEKVRAAQAKGDRAPMNGTSVSAPHVAGAAALLLQARPEATVDDLRAWLTATTQLIAPTEQHPDGRAWDKCLGFGRIDAAASLRKAIA